MSCGVPHDKHYFFTVNNSFQNTDKITLWVSYKWKLLTTIKPDNLDSNSQYQNSYLIYIYCLCNDFVGSSSHVQSKAMLSE